MPSLKLLAPVLDEAAGLIGRNRRLSVQKLIKFYKLEDLSELVKQFSKLESERVLKPEELVQLRVLHIQIGKIVNKGLFL
jgi:hypothetical protein